MICQIGQSMVSITMTYIWVDVVIFDAMICAGVMKLIVGVDRDHCLWLVYCWDDCINDAAVWWIMNAFYSILNFTQKCKEFKRICSTSKLSSNNPLVLSIWRSIPPILVKSSIRSDDAQIH